MPCMPDSSDRVALGPVAADQSGCSVWGRRARSGGIWGRWYLVWYWLTGPPGQGRPLAGRCHREGRTMSSGRMARRLSCGSPEPLPTPVARHNARAGRGDARRDRSVARDRCGRPVTEMTPPTAAPGGCHAGGHPPFSCRATTSGSSMTSEDIMDVPLHWQRWRLGSPRLTAPAEAVRRAGRRHLYGPDSWGLRTMAVHPLWAG
jgi:hypothetical protein